MRETETETEHIKRRREKERERRTETGLENKKNLWQVTEPCESQPLPCLFFFEKKIIKSETDTRSNSCTCKCHNILVRQVS
jgi:hypothetical protein